MRNLRWLSILSLLLLLALACNVPFAATGSQATQTASNIEFLAAQTITAQQLAATGTAVSQPSGATATAAGVEATNTAISLASTAQASSASATYAAQVAQATAYAQGSQSTAYAQSAQATAYAQSATATALAYFPPPPLPPPPQAPLPFPQPPQPQYNLIRISFPSGGTSANVDGQLRKGEGIDYVLRAGAGQVMLATIYSPNNNVYLGVVGLSDGVPLLRTAADSTQFSGVLPLDQDYRLIVFSPDQKSNYTLQVIIPARIKFARGAYSASVDGRVQGNSVNYYLLRASAGQTMSVAILSPHNDIFLTIYGMQDGSPLVRSVSGATTWSGILPGTQDYMIEAVSEGPNSNYTLQVAVH